MHVFNHTIYLIWIIVMFMYIFIQYKNRQLFYSQKGQIKLDFTFHPFISLKNLVQRDYIFFSFFLIIHI